jgi:colicin import membrane protein
MSAVLDTREDPGKWASAALAASVHALLIAFLFYGIRWQTRAPEAIEVELFRPEPAQPAAVQPPPPEPKPQPKIEAKPEPKPTPQPAKPDIALKEKEKPKPPPKAEPRPEPDKAIKKLNDDALKREQQQLEARKADHELAQMKQAQAASARNKATADYIAKIRGKIKGNIVLPPDIKGNPEAIFDVVQLPSGEILSAKPKKSSGHAGYDAAVERAILKSSPLPRPEQGDIFSRSLELKFRPLEE